MQKRKDSISALKICRFCLTQDVPLKSLYEKTRGQKGSIPLRLKIMHCTSIDIFPSDKMPTFICEQCSFFMEIFYDYKHMCRQSDETILQYIQDGTSIQTVEWPTLLNKVYNQVNKTEQTVMETVVEGGATIQVTSQGTDSEDEDEENVYNVKIGDGIDDSACIKVITSRNNKDVDAEQAIEKPKKTRKGFPSVTKLTRHVRTHAGDRAYPCKFCNKSFVKSHHYTRHLRLKHNQQDQAFGEADAYRCEQCSDSFPTQDDLIYHSAIHATQNLTCPLCQEKFHEVEAVTAHIKSHVNGVEFMCDLCELVFTTKEKLDNHMRKAHDEEIRENEELQEESSMDMEAEEDDDEDDNGINVKEDDDEMVIEIKKPSEFLLSKTNNDEEGKQDANNSEESETDTLYTELATVESATVITRDNSNVIKIAKVAATITKLPKAPSSDGQPTILRKAEEVKRKVVQQTSEPAESKEKPKENSSGAGASEKSLRLLEKELQDLKRTNSRNESTKIGGKPLEIARRGRPQIHTSTPKPRIEEKKIILSRGPVIDKKIIDRRFITKENKEPREVKNGSNSNGKEDKTSKEDKNTRENASKEEKNSKEDRIVKEDRNIREEKKDEKSVKEDKISKEDKMAKEMLKMQTTPEEGVRRSTRPSKIKDYAKMIRERSQVGSEEEESDDEDDEEYKDKDLEQGRAKQRRVSVKTTPKPLATPALVSTKPTPVRKRGRPRKDAGIVPAKQKKEESKEEDEDDSQDKMDVEATKSEEKSDSTPPPAAVVAPVNKLVVEPKNDANNISPAKTTNNNDTNKTSVEPSKPTGGVLVSPTGQTLKKIPIKALPPGVKPLPLPINARPMATGELCEMQIGKKMVKVQKIVMTKAEVEAMAKKGLVEMKDGTMVLKQGIKLPTSDPAALKSTLAPEESTKESPIKGIPTRCELNEE